MKYYKALKYLDLRVSPWVIIEGELFTETEYKKFGLNKYPIFEVIEISKFETYFCFNARYNVEVEK